MGRTTCTERQCLYKGALYLYLFTHLSGNSSVSIVSVTGGKNRSAGIPFSKGTRANLFGFSVSKPGLGLDQHPIQMVPVVLPPGTLQPGGWGGGWS